MERTEVIADRFVLEALIGRGGMGSVYRARDLRTQQTVALKRMTTELGQQAPQRFAREAQALASLSHPNIVQYLAHGTHQGAFFLAMEWLEGEELSARLTRGALSIEETLQLATQLAQALSVIHAKGIIHRDLKPANLFLVNKDLQRLKLLDFGIAKLEGAEAMTSTGAMLGTPQYMSPEQARGLARLTPSADIFAVGCVLFECLTGLDAFQGEHVVAILAKLLFGETPSAKSLRDEVPAPLDALLSRMLSKESHARPESGQALAEALAALPQQKSADAPPSLTQTARMFISVVLSEPLSAAAHPAEVSETPSSWQLPSKGSLEALQKITRRYKGRIERFVGGAVAIVFAEQSQVPLDLAYKAARCALAIRRALPQVSLALSMGQSEPEEAITGALIDRAAALLRAPRPTNQGLRWMPLRLDDASPSWLSSRFECAADESSALLLGERDERPRLLLGRPTPCIGRERELFWLESLLDDSQSVPRANVVVITAGAGVGKSRVRDEFLRGALQRDPAPLVLLCRGDLLRSEAPFACLAPALRKRFGLRDGEPEEAQRQKLRQHFSRHAAQRRTLEFFSELLGVSWPAEQSAPLQAARGDARLMREQLFRAFLDWLSLECSERSVLLVFEDLQWCDRPTVQFIDEALARLRHLPLMVVAFGRPETSERFPSLWAQHEPLSYQLTELSQKASERFIRFVLGGISQDRLEWLVESSLGNAFYLEELCRAEAEGRGQEVPQTVLAMAQQRLEGLSPEGRRILRAASIFGESFWVSGLLALLGEAYSADDVSGLVSQELFVQRPEGRFLREEELAFRHALFREASYASLTEADRALGHKLAAHWLLSVGERSALILASHFERGHELARALPWYQRAAEQALEAGDYQACVEAAHRGMYCEAQGETLGALQLLEAKAHFRFGAFQDTERVACEAFRGLAQGGALWFDAGRLLVSAYPQLRQAQACEEIALRLLSQDPVRGALPAAIGAWAVSAKSLFDLGRFEGAGRFIERLELLARRGSQEPMLYAWLPNIQATQALYTGKFGDFLYHRLAALDGFLRVDDRYYVSSNKISVGYGYFLLGMYPEAAQTLRQAMEQTRAEYPTLYRSAIHNLGLTLAYLGEFEEGYALEEEARQLAEERGALMAVSWCHSYSAQILYLWGDSSRAQRAALAALDLMEEENPSRPYTLAVLARALLSQGEPEEARSHAAQAISLMTHLQKIDEGEALIRLAHIEALFACDETEAALQEIEVAQQKILQVAAEISDPSWRKSFVRNIPENVALLGLAKQWLG